MSFSSQHTMSKIKIFIASVPLETGVTEYDTDELLENLPSDLKPVDREPVVSVNVNEIFFIWRCQKKSVSTLVINCSASNGHNHA